MLLFMNMSSSLALLCPQPAIAVAIGMLPPDIIRSALLVLVGVPLRVHLLSRIDRGAVYDFLIAGEFHQWDEGSLHVRKHFPGARIEHPDWAITSMHLEAGSWMLEVRGIAVSLCVESCSRSVCVLARRAPFHFFFFLFASSIHGE